MKMIRKIGKALVNAFDAIALAGLDRGFERRFKKAATATGWNAEVEWERFVEYNNSHQ